MVVAAEYPFLSILGPMAIFFLWTIWIIMMVQILAGALGAIVGDSALFWIARRNAHRVRPQLERAQSNQRVAGALAFAQREGRADVRALRPRAAVRREHDMGLSDRPYREFLP